MARQTRTLNPQAQRSRSPNPATGLPTRLRVPREMRSVTSSRGMPLIKLSGAWLERLGFSCGSRFLVIADDSNQILLARIDP